MELKLQAANFKIGKLSWIMWCNPLKSGKERQKTEGYDDRT